MFDENNQEILLDVSNIEVVYNNIILVLRGVSLTVEKGGITYLKNTKTPFTGNSLSYWGNGSLHEKIPFVCLPKD